MKLINRNWDEKERQNHGQQVRSRFAREREEKIRFAQKIIEEMLDIGVTISQNEVARRTGMSVGFVNKHLRHLVEKAQQQQKESIRKPRTERQISVLEKQLEHLKLSNQRLKDQLDEQRLINKQLLAQVALFVDLEDEVELLRKQSREFLADSQINQNKVVNLPIPNQSIQTGDFRKNDNNKSTKISEIEHQDNASNQTFNFMEQVESELSHLGITLNNTLRRKIKSKSPETVFDAIEAFKEALENGIVIRSPGGWFSSALDQEYLKNRPIEPSVSPLIPTLNYNKKQPEAEEDLVSPEELKSLSSIFTKSND